MTVARPPTLRDLRRLAALPEASLDDRALCADCLEIGAACRALAVALPGEIARSLQDRRAGTRCRPAQAVDLAIARLGADWSGEPPQRGGTRPKGMNEVAPSSAQPSDDAEVHGGDGNSGECDHAAETEASDARPADEIGGRQEQTIAPRNRAVGQDGGDTEPPERDDVETGSREPGEHPAAVDEEEHEPSEGEATSEDRDPTESAGSVDEDERQEDPVAVPGSSTTDDSVQSSSAHDDGGDLTSSSSDPGAEEEAADAQPREPSAPESVGRAVPVPGGWHARPSVVEQARRAARRASARDVQRALERLIATLDVGGIDESPRLDGRRLVREIAQRRCALSRARRHEMQHAIVVIACDVSGSCSAVCSELLGAAYAVVESDEAVHVIAHSNGQLDDGRYLATAIREIAAGRRVAGMIALGDWDAGDEYRVLLDEGIEFWWLDSYCARDGARPASRNLRAQAVDWRRQPNGWWQGVNTAAATAIALSKCARRRSA